VVGPARRLGGRRLAAPGGGGGRRGRSSLLLLLLWLLRLREQLRGLRLKKKNIENNKNIFKNGYLNGTPVDDMTVG
jgi:hypothetical protein